MPVGRLSLEFARGALRVGKLAIERLPIANAAAQELRPGRHGGLRITALGQQTPELGMVPAELVPSAVTMRAYAGAQTAYLGDQLVARRCVEILIHRSHLVRWDGRCAANRRRT